MSVNSILPLSSGGSINLNDICAGSSILILGVTGGIASGKSTVADMLKEMGAPIIDFDLLARQVVEPGKPAWREIVSAAVRAGISLPAMTASLAYFEAMRRDSLPANLIQAQRDFFGAHTYQRKDMDGTYHTQWQ